MVKVLWKFLFHKEPNARPLGPLPMQQLDSLSIVRKSPDLLRVTWFGHSASLVELAGKNILFDPMLSIDLGPSAWLTPPRYNATLPITPEQLPPIDAVLISHDHYDHLDYQTIRRIKSKVAHFYVPLGIGPHLRKWGVAPERITEMNWGDEAKLPGLTVVCTPSRHFSGRGLTNRNSTLWSSWVLKSDSKRVFYSGDGGYSPHFKAIGAAHGPFDLALIECGQYDQQWSQIHMMPEQSVQAAVDVRGKVMLPVHWAAFTEANHAWTDPIERATAAAMRLQMPVTTPRLGEPVVVGSGPLPSSPWWRQVQ
ncbi:MBL fold metallo-hydrolase [Hymenobacter volaticus]|uniref:MBL fold metallo-hydrolase n=1 Tax=Hymenobacter volaticus TaxID=2932254 RepID=A0ABY4G926_9BACT|nr:MBL fold metallo-hydrolase [Hymenobacter volaticus]UOQ67407.1 MBL fold metallo-hydrolase [Hymenobacter volaticus]